MPPRMPSNALEHPLHFPQKCLAALAPVLTPMGMGHSDTQPVHRPGQLLAQRIRGRGRKLFPGEVHRQRLRPTCAQIPINAFQFLAKAMVIGIGSNGR